MVRRSCNFRPIFEAAAMNEEENEVWQLRSEQRRMTDY
jgi:hypothetical protein